MTIRTRLTFLYASLLAIAMLVFSAATLSVLNWTLRSQVDNTLIKAAEDLHAEAMLGAVPATPNTAFDSETLSQLSMMPINNLDTPGLFWQIWLYDENTGRHYLYNFAWNLLSIGYSDPLDPSAFGNHNQMWRDMMVNDHHLRVLSKPLIINGAVRGYIQTGSSLGTVDAAIDRLMRIMLIGGTLTLLISLLLGDYLTRQALQPVDTIAQAAQQITAADDLSRRIPYSGPDDELGQLTRTFNKTLGRLEQLFNVQRRFVADVSHEMRTPLTTIRGNVDLMRRYGHDPEIMPEMIDAIDDEARRMSRLVEDLLLLAKADAGRLSLEKTVVSIDTLLLEVYNQAQILSEDKVTLGVGQIDQAHVLGDPDRIKQLLLNLVSNSIKYTPDGGKITLGIRRVDGSVHVDVTDTGIGIPEEDLPHIFDRFYRVDKARSRAQGGTGLGLSIAQWIAQAHGGRLNVKSTFGEGSTFTLTLPVVLQHTAHDAKRDTIPNLSAVRLPRSQN